MDFRKLTTVRSFRTPPEKLRHLTYSAAAVAVGSIVTV